MSFVLFAQIVEGFVVKSIASFDDTLTRIPVISHLTKNTQGRIVFSLGTLLALTVILIITVFFSSFLSSVPYTRPVTGILILALAIIVYFDVLTSGSNKQLESRLKAFDIPHVRFARIIGIGFLVSFITLIDDAIVLLPLFLGSDSTKFLSIIGVYLAAILQIFAVIYFGEKLERIKYKKEIAAASLLLLSVLVITGIV